MNKKGFTLVELLAVIAILGVVMLIATVSITGLQRKTNLTMFSEKVSLMVSSAVAYAEKDDPKKEVMAGSNQGCLVSGNFLINKGALDTDEKDSSNNKTVTDPINKTSITGLTIYVYMKYNRIYACVPTTNANKNLLIELENEDIDKSFYCSSDLTTKASSLSTTPAINAKMNCN